jgi:hypothetical protein
MKNKTNKIALRNIIALFLFILWGFGGFFDGGLYAQVNVSNHAVNYATKQVSFTVSWTALPYNNQIWVIVDYIQVVGAFTTGSWDRALVTEVTKNSGAGSASTFTGNRGFWLNTPSNSGSANVTATLRLADGVKQFNWCVNALDRPPNAVWQANGSYTLQGTLPFTINGKTLPPETAVYSGNPVITAFTDATDAPGTWDDPPCSPGRIGTVSATCDPNYTAGRIGN